MFDWDTGGGIRYDSEEYRTKVLKQDGGHGSGNFGHSGRKGKVGGSGKGGGARNHAKSKTVTEAKEAKKALKLASSSLSSEKKVGIIKPSKIISGHGGTPKKANPGDVIDHLGKDGKTETRTFYDYRGMKGKDITNHDHGNPKKHPFGDHGEHAHDYRWNEDGSLNNRTKRDITEKEKKENEDML